MDDRDAHYQLNDLVEIDDIYFGGHRNRGADKKMTVIVVVHLSTKGKPQYASMAAVENISEGQVTKTIKKQVINTSTIRTDAYSYYRALEKQGYIHKYVVVSGSSNRSELLKCV